MALVAIDFDPPRRTLSQFGVIALVVFGGLGAWTMYRHHLLGFELSTGTAQAVGGALLGLGILSGLLAAAAPSLLRFLYVGLVVITFPIGFVVSHVVLALLYYVVLTPVGLVMRLVGHDPMNRRWDPDATTYWHTRDTRRDVKSYFRQY